MTPLFFCLLVAVAAEDLTPAPPPGESASFEGSQVLTIFSENRTDIEKIVEEENIDIWAANKTHMDIFIPGEKVDVLKTKFSASQINYLIKISDVDSAIKEQNPPPSEEEDEELDGRKGHKMNWDKYQRLDVIYGYMDYLAQTYPNLVTVGVIGNSYENRPIKYIRISSGKPNPNVFVIDGGIHAREWISPATSAYIIRELVENRSTLPADIQEVEFYIVPVLNPDGYEYTHSGNRLWRKNKSRNYVTCSGTDLNRNFAQHWGGKGTSANPCSEIYRGRSALSENESRALANFIQGLRNVKGYVSFHSYGQYILIPYGYDYNAFPPDFKEMERVAIRASHAMARSGGQHYTVGNTAHTLYPASGGSDDWVKSQTGATYVYTIELRDKGSYGFTLPARQILPTSKEAYEAIKVIAAAAEAWKETEMKLLEKARQNEQQKIAIMNKTNNEIMQLKEKLKVAEETISILQLELKTTKEEKLEFEKINEELTVDITRLNCEIEEYKREMEDWRKSEKEKLLAIETNATIQGKLSQANTEVTRKQTEIVRLNGMIGQLRGELEKIRLGSVINQSSENLTSTISQLQAALAIERENSKEVVKEKETMSKEVLDLRRQVKEMENILIKRSKSGSGLPIGEAFYHDSYKESFEQKTKTLQAELSQTQTALTAKQQHLNDLQSKYDQDIFKLEQELKKLRKESFMLKNSLEERDRGPKPVPAAKEDAHLLATIRGLKAEISNRDKDIVKLNKELDEIRKTNRRLQREREKALNAGNKFRSNGIHLPKDLDKNSRSDSDQSSSKDYNPVLYAEEQENILFLRSENRSLKEEIKKLEQDLISLHNKRIQDLSDLQEQHESEISRLVREHAAKHSSSAVAHLQGQLYTQQMVIHHLKEQIKMFEGSAEEVTVLKAERDHLESTLIEANKKIARFHDLQSPESMQYSELLDKLDFLERRHEVREQKLQAIVRDLLTKQGQGLTCSSNCRDKLLNKNREICYYRAEMDKILDTLAEFRWNK